MKNYSFDRLCQIMPCPDREKCRAYLLPPLPDGTQRGCAGERKWCKMNFNNGIINSQGNGGKVGIL